MAEEPWHVKALRQQIEGLGDFLKEVNRQQDLRMDRIQKQLDSHAAGFRSAFWVAITSLLTALGSLFAHLLFRDKL